MFDHWKGIDLNFANLVRNSWSFPHVLEDLEGCRLWRHRETHRGGDREACWTLETAWGWEQCNRPLGVCNRLLMFALAPSWNKLELAGIQKSLANSTTSTMVPPLVPWRRPGLKYCIFLVLKTARQKAWYVQIWVRQIVSIWGGSLGIYSGIL